MDKKAKSKILIIMIGAKIKNCKFPDKQEFFICRNDVQLLI
jgi:hypothetical protein